MVAIEVDEETAAALARAAEASGLTVGQWLRRLHVGNRLAPAPSWEQMQKELEELSTDGPESPRLYDRSDFYDE